MFFPIIHLNNVNYALSVMELQNIIYCIPFLILYCYELGWPQEFGNTFHVSSDDTSTVPAIDETELGRIRQRNFQNSLNNMAGYTAAQLQQFQEQLDEMRNVEAHPV